MTMRDQVGDGIKESVGRNRFGVGEIPEVFQSHVMTLRQRRCYER